MIEILVSTVLGLTLLSTPSVAEAALPIKIAQTPIVVPVVVPVAPAPVNPVLCNCYLYVRSIYPSFPLQNALVGNSTPHDGVVVIMDYDGLPHYGIMRQAGEKGFYLDDTNFKSCTKGYHFIEWSNVHIVGFWAPDIASK